MEEKELVLETREVYLPWRNKVDDLVCRFSFADQVIEVKYQEVVKTAVPIANTATQVHILIQAEGIALGSLSLSFAQMFGEDLTSDMDEWVRVEVPGEIVQLLTNNEPVPKALRIRLCGFMSKKTEISNEILDEKPENQKVVEASPEAQEASPEAQEAQVEASPEAQVEASPEAQVEASPEAHVEASPEAQVEASPEAQVEASPEAQVEASPEAQVEASPEEQVEASPEAQVEASPEAQVEASPEAQVEASPEAQVEAPLEAQVANGHDNSKPRPDPIPIHAPVDSPKCTYLENKASAEFTQTRTASILKNLREEMGENFIKVIEEGTRRRSPSKVGSRSPVRSLSRRSPSRGSSKTPSQFAPQDFLDLPSHSDVYLESLSERNPSSLVSTILALLSKRTYYELHQLEVPHLKSFLKDNVSAIETLQSAMKETQEQVSTETENIKTTCSELQTEVKAFQEKLIGIKKSNEKLSKDKTELEQTLSKLSEESHKLKQDHNLQQITKQLKDLKKAYENSEVQCSQIRNQLLQEKQEFLSKVEETTQQTQKLNSEISQNQNQIQNLQKEINYSKKEQTELHNQILLAEAQLYMQEDRENSMDSFQKQSSIYSNSTDSLNSSIINLRGNKERFANDTYSLNQQLEAQTKSLNNSIHACTEYLKEKTANHSELKEELMGLNDYLGKLQEMYNKKANVHQHFKAIEDKANHNRETKDRLINELNYFSDFVFSLTETYLQEHRIFKILQSHSEEKEYEVNAMRQVVAEVKRQYPVYSPKTEDPIDSALADYLNLRDEPLLVPFTRESAGVYLFGTRRVLVKFERSKLSVKVGGGFLPIEDFIAAYSDSEVEKLNSRNTETSPRMKKFMAKWVGGLVRESSHSPERIREDLVEASRNHKLTECIGVTESP